MSDTRKEYVVEVGGLEHTVLLDEDDARRLGASAKLHDRKAVLNKARTVKSAE